jgi:hypothetical protein
VHDALVVQGDGWSRREQNVEGCAMLQTITRTVLRCSEQGGRACTTAVCMAWLNRRFQESVFQTKHLGRRLLVIIRFCCIKGRLVLLSGCSHDSWLSLEFLNGISFLLVQQLEGSKSSSHDFPIFLGQNSDWPNRSTWQPVSQASTCLPGSNICVLSIVLSSFNGPISC